MLSKQEATNKILAAKKSKGTSYEDIAAETRGHPVWVAAAVYGQASMPLEQADKLCEMLGLGPEISEALQDFPLKGCLEDTVPVDPLIYRFHEITQVYGTAMKAVIHEKFGDGIMSAIDFKIDIEKEENPAGDRVVITYNGKFLPYRQW